MHNVRSFYSQKGFTIIELLVVFSLISIITGVGFASFSSYSDSQKLTAGVRALESLLDDARNSALSGVIPQKTENGSNVSCSQSVSSYRIGICESGVNCLSSGVDYELVLVCGIDEFVLKTGNFQSGVGFGDNAPSNCRTISFVSLSGETVLDPQGENCRISVTNGSDSRNFLVNTSGIINEQ